jgi:eukaryotic-like serine/threonine-protein kinase
MAEDGLCPKCGGEVPGDAPQGLCPACLMVFALGDEPSEPSSEVHCDPTPTFSPDLNRSTLHDEATLRQTAFDPNDATTIPPVAPTEPASTSPPPLGSVRYFGDYELLSEIARGGMGVVYRARQVSLNRPVALKMILTGQLAGEDDVKRFHIEAEAAANLDHPGIVPIFEIGEHDGQHFFSMGFVEGTSLAARVADGPLPPREAADLTRQVAEAMHYAHDKGVIHRDLKPGNVLLDRAGHPKVTDFGLAKKLQSDSGLTQTGQVMGTPSYMPPEQAEGKEVGPLADVYSLGAVLYCLLTGRPPFQAASPMDTLKQVVEQEPVPARQLNPSVPRDLETICLKCLEKEPGKRYASAGALAEDLNRFHLGEPIQARPVGTAEQCWRWCRRNPAVATLTGTMTFLLLATSVVSGLAAVEFRRLAVAKANALQTAKHAEAEALATAAAARESARYATEQKTRANREAERALQAKQDAERNLYYANLALAPREWTIGHDSHARALLEACPTYLREWEWQHLDCQFRAERLKFTLHNNWVIAAAWSPDGKRVATGGRDGKVHVWDAATGKVHLTLPGHASDMQVVAFHPTGTPIAIVGPDGVVQYWDAATGKPSVPLTPWQPRFADTSFSYDAQYVSPDGKRFAVATRNNLLVVSEKNPARESFRVEFTRDGASQHSRIRRLLFSPDGSRLAVQIDRNFLVLDARTGLTRIRLPGHEQGAVQVVAFSPDGTRLVTGGSDNTARIWAVSESGDSLTLNGHSKGVVKVSFNPDGRLLASGSQDGTVKVWDMTTGTVVRTLNSFIATYPTYPDYRITISGVAFNPQGERLLTIERGGVVLREASTGQELLRCAQSGSPISSVYSRDGRLIAIAGDANLQICDAVTGKLKSILKTGGIGDALLGGIVNRVAFSPDGDLVAILKRRQGQEVYGVVQLWNVQNGRVSLTLGDDRQPAQGLVFGRDGSILIVAQGSNIDFWDLKTTQRIRSLAGHGGRVNAVAISPKGNRLATASDDGSVKLWDVTTGQDVLTLTGHAGPVLDVAFSADGKRIASGGADGTVKLWDAFLAPEPSRREER